MSFRPVQILFAALVLAAPAVAATVATPATLRQVIDTADPGAAIVLAAGTYDSFQVRDRHWSPPVTVDATAATLHGFRLDNISGLTWHGGTFEGGDVERNGINVLVADHLIIDGVKFSHFTRNAIGLGTVSDARITNNLITDSGSDGIDVALSRRIVLDHNRCTDFHPTPGAHPDCIQMWSRPEQPPTADIVISNNEAIGDVQGFTGFNHVRPDKTGKIVNDGGYDRITIENNLSRVSSYHGVTINECRGCIVRNNRAETLPDVLHPKVRAWIKVIDSPNLTMCGNVAVAFPGDPGQKKCTAEEMARQTTTP